MNWCLCVGTTATRIGSGSIGSGFRMLFQPRLTLRITRETIPLNRWIVPRPRHYTVGWGTLATGKILLRDVRQAYEIVGECRELWADPREWRRHLLRRVAELTNCRVAFRMDLSDEDGRIGERLLSGEDVGWDSESGRRTLIRGLTASAGSFSPMWNAFASALANRRELTALQPALIEQRRWHASEVYDSCVRPTRIGEGLMSAVRVPRNLRLRPSRGWQEKSIPRLQSNGAWTKIRWTVALLTVALG
jgi:hypothetical protein